MNRFLSAICLPVALVVAATASEAPAQSSVVAPALATSEEGLAVHAVLGSYPTLRFQLIEGDFRNQAFTIREVAHRLDTQPQYAPARTWTNVTLSIAQADYLTSGSHKAQTFTRNYVGKPSVVFNKQVSWPVLNGLPKVHRPTDFSVRFPFSTPWAHTGKLDFLIEYVFRGGALVNAGPWSGRNIYSGYGFDAELLAGTILSPPVSGINIAYPHLGNSCADSGGQVGPTAQFRIHAQIVRSGPTVGMLSITPRSSYTAANAPVIHAFGLAGNTAGVQVGARCQRLFVDLTKPWVAMFLKTTVAQSASSGPFVLPYSKALGSTALWGQAAWTDSKTKQFGLTQATRLYLPQHKKGAWRRAGMWSLNNPPSPTASLPSSDPGFTPITRYKK